MATVTRENIGLLHDKLTVTVTPADYQTAFEKNLKQYAKSANIPGFRKGMVPAGLIRKMYGQGIFVDEVLKTMEKEVNDYLTNEKLKIFAQPLPLANDTQKIDVQSVIDYSFDFEIGLQPTVNVDVAGIKCTRYQVNVTDKMIDDEVARLQKRFGNMTEPEVVESEETTLNIELSEVDAAGSLVEGGSSVKKSLALTQFQPAVRASLVGKKVGDVLTVTLAEAFDEKESKAILDELANDSEAANKSFQLTITKLGLLESAALDETFFAAAYPSKTIATEAELRDVVKEDIAAYFASQASNQLHDQIYHHLTDHVSLEFPEAFLKNWLARGGEKAKSEEEVAAEFPSFISSLKWSVISNELSEKYAIEVTQEDIKSFAVQQLLGYMGGNLSAFGDDTRWIDDYANRMLKDKKFVEETYQRVSVSKLFEKLEGEVAATVEPIEEEAFIAKINSHHHHH